MAHLRLEHFQVAKLGFSRLRTYRFGNLYASARKLSNSQLPVTRYAKSGSYWTSDELEAYNIIFVDQTKLQFFGSKTLSAPTRPSLVGFMKTENWENAKDDETRKLLHYLDLALDPKVGQETAVDNFAAKLLEKLEYDKGDRIIFIQRALQLIICGVPRAAQTNICVTDDDGILLLLQENKRLGNKRLGSDKKPENQIIAEAIAAFAVNNDNYKLKRKRPLTATTFPAITMVGTNPIFYKIPITAQLSTAVQTGRYPEKQTKVLWYTPDLPKEKDLGMRPLENRIEILACLEAFKRFL